MIAVQKERASCEWQHDSKNGAEDAFFEAKFITFTKEDRRAEFVRSFVLPPSPLFSCVIKF